MIIFKSIRAKNFLSIGDTYVDYELDQHNLTLARGRNGHGKCVDINTKVKLRNKNTGEIIEITVGEFYELHKK